MAAVDKTPTEDDLGRVRSDLDSGLAAVRAEVSGLVRSVRLIGQKVDWLMTNALITPDAPIRDLDADVDDATRKLAADVERGERYQDQLLDSTARKELKVAVDRHWEWSRNLDRRQGAVIRLSEAIVGTDESAAVRAADDFRAAWQALTELEQDGPRLENAARAADERLARDDEIRRRHGKDIEAVGQAWQELCRTLRDLIDSGVARHALFPGWFRDSLGLAPPPEAPTRWFELATEILAYRITYGITHDDAPLGDPPSGDASRRRRQWYQRLRAGLVRLT
jgi:hypothetical protein